MSKSQLYRQTILTHSAASSGRATAVSSTGEEMYAEQKAPSVVWQIVVYSTVVLSILASRFLDYYREDAAWSLLQDWQYLIFAIIVSLFAFPIVYRKSEHSKDQPILVQLGLIFSAGLGWEKLLSTTAEFVKPIALK